MADGDAEDVGDEDGDPKTEALAASVSGAVMEAVPLPRGDALTDGDSDAE